MALLNSRTLGYRYKSIGKQTGGGIFEYFENQVSKLPIPLIDKKQQEPFVEMVEAIVAAKQNNQDTATKEAEFDQMVGINKRAA